MDLRAIWKKVWFVLWEDDSPLSILISFVVAWILIQYLLYPGLGLLLGTELPVVAVISGSMEHRATLSCPQYENIAGIVPRRTCAQELRPMICGEETNRTGWLDPDEYWQQCGSWYEERGISQEAFAAFPMPNGFNTGDIIVLRRASDVQIGDIIVFSSRRPEPIIHRVVDVQLDDGIVYSTKGDHNADQIREYDTVVVGGAQIRVPVIDETRVTQAQVIGEAWIRIPWLGYPKLWLTQLLALF